MWFRNKETRPPQAAGMQHALAVIRGCPEGAGPESLNTG